MKLRQFGIVAFAVCSLMAGINGNCTGNPLGEIVLYVDDDAPLGGDGFTWETAHRFLQEALTDAKGGGIDEIHVAQGVYKPDQDESNPDGTGSRSATFSLVSGVALMGGYAGIGASDPDERSIEQYVTILSGDLLNNDEPDFVNYDENSYHVSIALNMGLATSLDGFTIMSGNANGLEELDEGGGLRVQGGSLIVTHCIFHLNRTFGGDDGFQGGAGIFCKSASITVLSCLFDDNQALESKGGGIRCKQAEDATINDCLFVNNYAGVGGGGMFSELSSLTVARCDFSQNQTEAAGAGVFIIGVVAWEITNCNFTNNNGGFAGGGIVTESMNSEASISNCYFSNNSSLILGGGAISIGDTLFDNCSFSGNSSPLGGGLFCHYQTSLVNCTIGSNSYSGIHNEGGNAYLRNCIVWDNSPDQFVSGYYNGAFSPEYCNIQGGWQGTGNIDVNPLFVNPGNNNLRLSFGSPCIDAGNNFLVPDWIDYDLDGNPRFVDDPDVEDTGEGTPPIVDMGAYEGGNESEDANATEEDFDQGETVFLIPSGGGINFLENAIVIVTNVSGPDDATFSVTEMQWDPHPSAAGFSELSSILRTETSLEDGQFFAQLFIPFDLEQLGGLDPLILDATNFHNGSGNWVLGTVTNTQDSPGRNGPIGDKIQVINSGQGFGITSDIGDYGVLWDPKLEQGFVWMNVDRVGDFGLGEQLCIADCQPFGGDSFVHASDLLTMFSAWGPNGGSGICDFDRNDFVGESDLLILLINWGLCGGAASEGGSWDVAEAETLVQRKSRINRSADLDNNGIVNRLDLLQLHAAWGPVAEASPADLDADGKVGTADLIKLLANWGRIR